MMSQDDINSLMSGIDDEPTSEDTKQEAEIDTNVADISISDDDDFDLDSLVNEFSAPSNSIDDELEENNTENADDLDIDNLDIDNLDLDNIDSSDDSQSALDSLDAIDDDDFDVNNLDIEALAGSISTDNDISTDDTSVVENETLDSDTIEDTAEDIIENISTDDVDLTTETPSEELTNEEFTTQKIDEGVFPLPVERDTKVVNQLNEVAKDGEEKATQIFDVLSYILDENNELQSHAKEIEELATSQAKTLETLTKKFPKIKHFKSALNQSSEITAKSHTIRETIDAENMKLFEAMELMQFQDINRQKIERVMSVIKKLSNYLNNLFEDEDGATDNLAIAKQIHGDDSESVDSDDLESLISEYSAEDL
jgi:hypothetical protein